MIYSVGDNTSDKQAF